MTAPTASDRAALRAAAEKATPGPWEARRFDGHDPSKSPRGASWPGVITGKDGQFIYAGPFSFHALIGRTVKEAASNAAYIAACSPEVIAALTRQADEADRLRAMLPNLATRELVEAIVADRESAAYQRGRSDGLEAAAQIANDHECGGEDDILCNHQNCGLCISGAISRLARPAAERSGGGT